MPKDVITSTANPRVKALGALRRRAGRRAASRYLIEGARELATALDAAVPLVEVVVCAPLTSPADERLVDRAVTAGAARLDLAEAPYRRVAYRENPGGVIAVAPVAARPLDALVAGSDALVLIVEGVEKPGNLGAMLRTADATGAAVVVADPVIEFENPNVIRASQGAVFTVPTAVATSSDVIAWAVRHRLQLFGGSDAAPVSFWQAPLDGPIGIVVGRESQGLSGRWGDALTLVRIPMAGSADSLNAATAAALLLYEVVRRRSTG